MRAIWPAMHPILARGKTRLSCAMDEWRRDHGTMLAAAVAFYATFSIVPLLVLLLNTTALLLGEAAARNRLLQLVSDTAGTRSARAVERLISAASDTDTGTTALSIAALILAASGVFRHLKLALNLVLDVPTKEDRGVLLFLWKRLYAVLVVVSGILLLVVAFAAAAALEWAGENLPSRLQHATLWSAAQLVATFAVLSLLFGCVLKFVPDVRLKWSNVALGAVLAALAFTAGQYLVSIYVARSGFTDTYGAAGSIVLLLVYFYLASIVILAAAEITEVFARDDAEFRNERRDAQDDERDFKPRKDEEPATA